MSIDRLGWFLFMQENSIDAPLVFWIIRNITIMLFSNIIHIWYLTMTLFHLCLFFIYALLLHPLMN